MDRARWGRRLEFFLMMSGYSFGVGLWRFPYLVMKNGGGAFLIPVVVFNIVGAIPIVYLEMIMGQYSQSGAVSVWNVCPLFKGVGYGTLISTFIFAIYYPVILSWMMYYFIHSFFNTLPWASCDNDWNIKETCVVSKEGLLNNDTTTNMTSLMANVSMPTENKLTASVQFWRYGVHRITDGLENLGNMNWALFGCLIAVEVLCFLCIFKGIKLTGKVVYFTVLGPYIIIFVFLIRGAMLPGAEIGIKHFVMPDLEKLQNPAIWAEACMQVFYSIGPGFGAIITFASYNKFSNNCMRDAIIVCLMDLVTGFCGGFVIFSMLGHVSYKTGIPIDDFKESGFGLGFVAYPEAANYLPPPQLWCALFFFMSIFLGIDSQFPNYEIVVASIKDEFPKYWKSKTPTMTVIVILIAFLLALPQVTQGGIYLVTLVDWYGSTFSVTVFSLLECLVMTWIYGMGNIEKNVIEMTGRRIPVIFKIAWYFATPALLLVTLGFTVYSYSPPAYSGYVYPRWAVAMGWCIVACSLVPTPVYMIYKLYNTPGDSKSQKLRISLTPTELWGPPDEIRKTTEAIDDVSIEVICIENQGFEEDDKIQVFEEGGPRGIGEGQGFREGNKHHGFDDGDTQELGGQEATGCIQQNCSTKL